MTLNGSYSQAIDCSGSKGSKNKLRQFALLSYVVIKDSFYTADEIVERGIRREEGS